ncbi:hypothetical protein [Ligilactobacillus acidipiscis]|uniref:hypothetical protein n=1 Tax=Ligilactobacillus acidipiscis TaxID=89059 RepID=UPI0023F68B07|nr:hypothetical protein [Ligilactobacillus acidipiscis]WEV57437.1 hypothetical protein OZX66_02515 [Ligilactobacillus acidipiscis]
MQKITIFFEKYAKKKILFFLGIIIIIIASVLLGVVTPYLMRQTNGIPYLETIPFYNTTKIYHAVKEYGVLGRTIYLQTSVTLDILLPLMTAIFLIILNIYLYKKVHRQNNKKFSQVIILLGLVTCLSDWLENICMITVLKLYPIHHTKIVVVGAICTNFKYLMMIGWFALLVYLLYRTVASSMKKSSQN